MIVALLQLAALAGADPAKTVVHACNSRSGGDIVVCGSRGASPYRLPKLPERYDARRIRAETNVAGVRARAHVDSVGMPGGNRSNRVMITLGTGF